MSYWGDGYWADGYWHEAYWGEEVAIDAPGSLYVDRCLEVIKFTFQRKDGSGSDSFHIAQDYWSAGSLYPGSPEILPVLAQSVSTARGTDGVLGTINDISVSVYGKSHFNGYGKSFFDLADSHEFRGADVAVMRYFVTELGSPIHDDSVNLRQVLKLKGYNWQDDTLSLECQDYWFDDREVSKRLIPGDFDDLQDEFQYAYGAIIFGEGKSGNGVIVDAPVISSNDGDSGGIKAKMFLGHVFPGHDVDSVQKVYAQNIGKQEGEADWVEIEYGVLPQTPWEGSAIGAGIGSQYPRYLSLYGRGMVVSPSNKGRMLSTVFCSLSPSEGYWAADFNGSNNLYRMDDRAYSPGDQSFTMSCWVKFDALGQVGIIGKGNLSDGTAEWGLYLRSSSTRLRFYISSTGSSIDNYVEWSANAVTGVWYHVFAWHDMLNRQLGIIVNNGTAVTASTVVSTGTAQSAGTEADGRDFIQLAAGASAVDDAYNGRMCFISSGAGADKVKYALDYVGASKKFYMKSQFSPAANNTSVYSIIDTPNRVRLDGEEDKAGPLQLGYIGGVADHLDGQLSMFGFWSGGVVSLAYRASIYNSGNGKAYEDLTEDEKFNLVSWHDLKEFYGERKDSNGSRHLADAASVGSADGVVNRDPDPKKGEMRLRVSRAVLKPGEDSYAAEDQLRDFPVDMTRMGGAFILGSPIAIPIDPPLLVIPGNRYFVTTESTNIKGHEYSYRCNYSAESGKSHYARLNEEQGAGWAKQENVRLHMALHVISESGGFVSSTGSAPYYSHFTVASYSGSLLPGIPFPAPSKGTAYKFGLRGLKDDASGTYTGSAGTVIKNPSDVLRFLLMNGDFGLGLPSSRVDTASLTATRAALGSLYNVSFAIDRQAFAMDVIRKICVQSSTTLHKTRIGKLAHHFPTWHAQEFDARIDEIRYRDQMTLLNVQDVPDEAVYNDFLINYGVDPLNMPKTPDFIYRAGSANFSATAYLNSTESSESDPQRITRMAASKALYGDLQYRLDFDVYAADSAAPKTVMNRIADRFYKKVKRVTTRVPLKDFFTHDLFDTLALRHTELPCEGGASKRLLLHDGGDEVEWRDNGVPTAWFKQGAAEGVIVNWVEYDQWVDITLETMNPF